MTAPVLILGTEPRVALTIARSLWRHGVTVDVASLAADPPRFGSRAVRRLVSLPGRADQSEAFREAVESLIADGGYDTLIPTSDSALCLVAGCHESLSRRLHVCCPPPEVVRRVLDKDVTLEIAKALGLLVPRIVPITEPEQIAALAEPVSFPLVAKDRSKSLLHQSTFKVRYFLDAEDMNRAWRADPELGSRILLQEYCPGDGVGIAMLIHEGEAVAAFQHRRRKEFPSTGGVAVLAVAEPLDPLLYRQALALLRALEWEGVAMVEFRHDRRTGRAVLMEVNGRYWGTCSLAVRSGLDFPFYEWQIAHGERPAIPTSYRAGLAWRWTAGYMQRLHELMLLPPADNLPRPSAWRALLDAPRDLGPWTISALGSWQDPVPAWRETAVTAARLVRASARALVRRLIPGVLLDHLRIARTLQPPERAAFHRLWAGRALGLRRNRPGPDALRSVRSILFVCHGNIIRSALAEALLRRELADRDALEIASAGIHAVAGRAADERACQVAHELGVSLQGHRAQPLTAELVDRSQLIFVMDHRNEAGLVSRFPSASGRLFLLGLDAVAKGHAREGEIADPYTGDIEAVRQAARLIQARVRGLARALRQSPCAPRDLEATRPS
jgi:protein-tyrosine-phosphatase/predicted ATP-grasp superfamily ATP-dependent carboligase